MTTIPCRECNHEVSERARACPSCGAPSPAKSDFDGYGFEWISPVTLFGLPLVHVSFKYHSKGTEGRRAGPVVARGIVAIGQFGYGVVCIAQFGIGLIGIGQFTLAGFAVAQFAVAYALVAQLGVWAGAGIAQVGISLPELVERVTGWLGS